MKKIDARSLACPGPVLEVKSLLEAGERTIEILVADELSRSNVSRFATTRGAEVSSTDLREGGFSVFVEAGGKSADAHAGEEEFLVCDLPEELSGRSGPTVVQVTSSAMGAGDDDLGELLLRSFLKTQLNLEHLPDTIVFYNRGVTLCCEGSLVLEDLQTLADKGVEIIACGTCLNFFDLSSDLAVGRGTDMLEIAGLLAQAGHIVRP